MGDEVEEVLHAHLSAGGGRFRGIRYLPAWDADSSLMNPLSAGPPEMLADSRFRERFARLAFARPAVRGLALSSAASGAGRSGGGIPADHDCPCHCGGILGIGAKAGWQAEIFGQWTRDIKGLARHGNIHVKIGGLGMRINGFGFERGDDAPTSARLAATWRPYVETCPRHSDSSAVCSKATSR
jgi:L-fuconolactonase